MTQRRQGGAGSQSRIVAAVFLVLGGSTTLASAPLSASMLDASPERSVAHRVTDPAMGHASRKPGGDPMALMPMKGPVEHVDWWIGFRDSTLNLLEQMARERPRRPTLERTALHGSGVRADAVVDGVPGTYPASADDVAASLASAYVQARVLRIRLATAQAVIANARRQSDQAKVAPGNTGAQEGAAAMTDRAQRAAADFQMLLERCVGEIGALTGMETAQARTVLEPSLSSSQLPVFDVAVPSRLPAPVVRGRADVRSLEVSLARDRTRSDGQRRMAEFAAALDGWIEPSGSTPAEAARPDVVARAKAEVGIALYRLIRQQQAGTMNYQISQLRRTEFDTVLQRQKLGEAADTEVLEKQLLLLVENDRLAAAVGAIADSWIALNAATGGQAALAARSGSPQSSSAGGPQVP